MRYYLEQSSICPSGSYSHLWQVQVRDMELQWPLMRQPKGFKVDGMEIVCKLKRLLHDKTIS